MKLKKILLLLFLILSVFSCGKKENSDTSANKEKEVKKENPLSHEGTVEPQPSQNSVTKSVIDLEQVGLPKTGDSSSNVFFSLLGALTGFLGFSLIKKRKSER